MKLEPQQAKILIVDDQEANILLLRRLLQELGGYSQIASTTNPRETFTLLTDFEPDIILLDLAMPELDGFGVMEQLGMILPKDSFLPIIVLTADISALTKQRALQAGARDFLTKPFDSTEALLRIRNLLETRSLHLKLEARVLERTHALQEAHTELFNRAKEVEAAQIEVLERLGACAEFRDDATGQHTQRVGHLATQVARVLGLNATQIELISKAAPLHDVGKIGIPDAILLKPKRLDPIERAQVQRHTTIGAHILRQGRSELIRMAEEIALTHHERFDGTGYPNGLAGEEIPISGRIVAIVDVYDALTHERPYKHAWSHEDAMIEIKNQSGKGFDPKVVAAFVELLEQNVILPNQVQLEYEPEGR
jgi:putative two-component system response regulator